MSHDLRTPSRDLFVLPHRTFFGSPAARDLTDLSVDVALVGVPYDGGTMSNFLRTGAASGPSAVREQLVFSYNGDYYDLGKAQPGDRCAGWFDVEEKRTYLEGTRMVDVGDVSIPPGDTLQAIDRITAATESLAARDAVVVAVGGDHSISFPVGRGMSRYEEIDVVHFDAHPDFWDDVNGSRYSHGSNLRRLSELPFVRNITMVGLRKCPKDVYEQVLARGVTVITSKDLVLGDPAEVTRRLVPTSRNLYVSIDTDVLDAALVPDTTLPEPFGLSYRALRSALWEVSKKGTVRGFDVVEMGSRAGNIASARTTAWILAHFLGAIIEARG